MRHLTIQFCLMLLFSITALSQVPTPRSTTDTGNSGVVWTKTDNYNYVLKKNGKTVNTQDLKYLKTDTLAVLDSQNRDVYLLADFKNASAGTSGQAVLLKKNVGDNFFITNPYSFAHYADGKYYQGEFSNINGNYLYYLAEKDMTYLLKNIRKFNNWGAGSSSKLPKSPGHVYWCRVVESNSYHCIKEGKSLDYTNIKSEFRGDDLVLKENGVDKYLFEGYKNTASYIFKPAKTLSSSNNAIANSNCVSGDCQNGWGKMTYGEDYYDGFWKNGKKDGYGLYKWQGQGKYIGNWSNGQMQGYGVYIADNNDNIAGYYSNGQLNGRGYTVIGDKWEQGMYSDGSITSPYTFYTTGNETGCTAGDCQDKYGRFKWDNGDQFTGFFKNGKLLMGTYTFASGDKYSGMFNSNNQFHGTGRFFFSDGAYYGGEWSNGKYQGRGYYHNKDYQQDIGEWNNGKLVKSLK